MSQTEHDNVATNESAIADWLIGRLRFYGQVEESDITLDSPITELGLDSIYVMTLCGDIEDTYEISADPTMFVGLETLGDVATELSARVSAA